MEYGRALGFPRRSEGWVAKILIGVVVNLVPILNLALYGYGIEVTRRVALGEAEELPPWDQLGRYLARGFAVTVASFLYILPGILIFLLLGAVGEWQDETLFLVGGGIYGLYGLILAFVLPVAFIRYALTDVWYTMFDFGWVFRVLGRNFGSLLLAYLVWIVVATVLLMLGTLAFGIGALFTAFWALLMFFHLLGQIGHRVVVARQR